MHWWLGAAVAIVVERIATCSYFIPTMLKLQRAETFLIMTRKDTSFC
jgi:hypothetical protein